MAELYLPSVFWSSAACESAEDALVTVEDGDVVHVTRADGFEVRLLVHELLALCKFVADEVEQYEEAEAAL